MEFQSITKPKNKRNKPGNYPGDWTVKLFDEFANFFSGGTPITTNKSYYEGDIPFIKSGEIDSVKTEQFISSEALKKSSAKIVKEGDILFALYGANSGEVAISKIEGAINQAILCIRPKAENYFIKYFLELNKNRYIARFLQGGQGNLSGKIVKNLMIPLPSEEEQKKITEIILTWDEAIEKTQQLIEQLELRKKGLMQELLTGKKRLPGFDGEWKDFSYQSLLKEVKRPVEWDDDELYQLISVRRRSGGLFKRSSLYGKEILTKNLRTAKEGDFLISKMQIVHGASGLVTSKFDEMKISGSYIAVRAKNEKLLDMNFFSWISKLPEFYHQTFISSYGVHIEKMTFNYKSFLKLKTRIPQLDEQIAISKVLEASELEIKRMKRYSKQLQIQKKGLMQQLLSGKKRVKIDE